MCLFFTSDTHFTQNRTLELSKRPFKTIFEMDKTIIEKWNSIIDHDDIVYHLGNIGNVECFKQLNGKIYLLPGNYDTVEELEKVKDFCILLKPNTILSHLNLQLIHKPSEFKFIKKENFVLFGHIHKLQMVKHNGLNVSTDCHNFTPLRMEEINFYRNGINNHYDNNVFGDQFNVCSQSM